MCAHRNSKLKDKFHNAIRKYGFENFKYEVLFKTYSKDIETLKFVLDTMETYYIKKYDSVTSGYNISYGGYGKRGVTPSKETKEKMSEAHKGIRAKGKPIVVIKDNCIIYEFKSIQLAADTLGINRKQITRQLSGETLKNKNNLVFKYKSL